MGEVISRLRVGAASATLAFGALMAMPIGFVLITLSSAMFQALSVAADARLQAAMEKTARATTTSLAGGVTVTGALAVLVAYAVGSGALPHATLFALFAALHVTRCGVALARSAIRLQHRPRSDAHDDAPSRAGSPSRARPGRSAGHCRSTRAHPGPAAPSGISSDGPYGSQDPLPAGRRPAIKDSAEPSPAQPTASSSSTLAMKTTAVPSSRASRTTTGPTLSTSRYSRILMATTSGAWAR